MRLRFNIVTLTSDIHVFLGLPLLRLPQVPTQVQVLRNSCPMCRVCSNQASFFSSILCKIFFFTFIVSLIVSLRTFSSLDYLAYLLQKSISIANNLSFCLFFKVQVSNPYRTTLWKIILYFFLFCTCYDVSVPKNWVQHAYNLSSFENSFVKFFIRDPFACTIRPKYLNCPWLQIQTLPIQFYTMNLYLRIWF